MRKQFDKTYRCLGASNHSLEEREELDYYATPPLATEWLCKLETFDKHILEPCCGEGAISEVLKQHNYHVTSYDIVDRGYGEGIKDFFLLKRYNLPEQLKTNSFSIVTNPPYGKALEFVEHSIELLPDNGKLAMFLRIQFLEGKERRLFFEQHPPIRIWVSSSRLACAKSGEFEKHKTSAICFCWIVFQKGYKGKPTLDWFN